MKRSKKRRLKMTTQYVDFLGVEIFNFIINHLLIDVANELKVDEKKFYAILYEGFKIQVSKPNQVIKAFKVFVYLEWKISNFNYQFKDEFFFFKWGGGGVVSDVGDNLQFNICNSLILVFYVIYIILGLGYLFPYF